MLRKVHYLFAAVLGITCIPSLAGSLFAQNAEDVLAHRDELANYAQENPGNPDAGRLVFERLQNPDADGPAIITEYGPALPEVAPCLTRDELINSLLNPPSDQIQDDLATVPTTRIDNLTPEQFTDLVAFLQSADQNPVQTADQADLAAYFDDLLQPVVDLFNTLAAWMRDQAAAQYADAINTPDQDAPALDAARQEALDAAAQEAAAAVNGARSLDDIGAETLNPAADQSTQPSDFDFGWDLGRDLAEIMRDFGWFDDADNGTALEGTLDPLSVNLWWLSLTLNESGQPQPTDAELTAMQQHVEQLIALLDSDVCLSDTDLAKVEATIVAKTAVLEWVRTGIDPRDDYRAFAGDPTDGPRLDDEKLRIMEEVAAGDLALHDMLPA